MFENFIHQRPHAKLRNLTQMTTTIFAGAQLDGMAIKDFAGRWGVWFWRCTGEKINWSPGDTKLQVGDTLVIQLTGAQHLQEQAQINAAAHQSARK